MSHQKSSPDSLPNKDILTIDDSDGKLHLYVCAAFNGKRWAAEMVFDEDKRTATYFKQQGNAFISATARPLLKAKIISE